MSEIEAYGFDYDYTLAQYSVDVQHEIYESALHHLIYEFKYHLILHYPHLCEFDSRDTPLT